MKEEKKGKGMGPALALWALLARSSIYKILAVLVLMVPAEVILFCRNIKTEYHTLTTTVESSHISVVFLTALGLVYFALVWTEGQLDSRSGGTMLRLRLSGSRIFWIKTAYNTACLVLLFAVQIWLCIWLVGVYGREAEEVYASPQRLFLAFYRIDFLHCLLPMAEAGKWVRNVLLLLSFGMEAARRAEKTEYIQPILLYVLTANWFVSLLGGNVIDWICIILYTVLIVVNVRQVREKEREEVQSNA
ncbi:MAG: hypothetical protein K2K63_09390 [Acetatifactor sp.]|nr:hypothetical protein [Acetatifactor sp.]